MLFNEIFGVDDEKDVETTSQKSKSSFIPDNETEDDNSPTSNSTNEKDNANQREKIYTENSEELSLLVVNLFKSVEKFLFDIARGNIGISTIKFLGNILSVCFEAKKLYSKKRFFLNGQDKQKNLVLYKRLYNFNRTFLVQTLGGRDRIKIEKYKKYLEAK